MCTHNQWYDISCATLYIEKRRDYFNFKTFCFSRGRPLLNTNTSTLENTTGFNYL